MRRCNARLIEGFDFLIIGGKKVGESELQNIPYRWKNEQTLDEQFQVLYNGEWCDAQSIDFEFDY
jgi:hypothetical protein